METGRRAATEASTVAPDFTTTSTSVQFSGLCPWRKAGLQGGECVCRALPEPYYLGQAKVRGEDEESGG